MKTYFCVITRFAGNEKSKAILTDIRANEKPKDIEIEKELYDEYRNYFDTFEEAANYAKSFYFVLAFAKHFFGM